MSEQLAIEIRFSFNWLINFPFLAASTLLVTWCPADFLRRGNLGLKRLGPRAIPRSFYSTIPHTMQILRFPLTQNADNVMMDHGGYSS